MNRTIELKQVQALIDTLAFGSHTSRGLIKIYDLATTKRDGPIPATLGR